MIASVDRWNPVPPELERALRLRPANVIARVGPPSALPLLNPRDIVQALGSRKGVLLCVPVVAPELIPGVLRAARLADGLVGLACPFSPGDRGAVSRLIGALMEEGSLHPHRLPIFLQAGPVRVGKEQLGDLGGVTRTLFESVEAGCTLVSIDATRVDSKARVDVYAALAAPLQERELALEVSVAAREALDADELKRLLTELLRRGVRPDFVRVDSRLLSKAPVKELIAVTREHGSGLSIEDRHASAHQLESWVGLGARKVDVDSLSRCVLRTRTAEARARVEAFSRTADLSLSDALALEGPADPVEGLEAQAFFEAHALLEEWRAGGVARDCLASLAERLR